MAFLRRETSETMVSRANSTSDLARGLEQILEDMNNVQPDDLVRLQEFVVESCFVLPAGINSWTVLCSLLSV